MKARIEVSDETVFQSAAAAEEGSVVVRDYKTASRDERKFCAVGKKIDRRLIYIL